jgi:photosystem II stability/assembly factor-like uncharacterized protein
MTDEFDPLKEALRDSLHRHAADAPHGDMLAERIINTAQRAPELDPQRTRRGWRTWTLPLIAAGAVAAVVGAVVGIENFRPEASHNVPPGTRQPSVLSSSAPTQIQSTSPGPTTSNAPGALTNFTITDLTFYGDNHGWALGSANCVVGPGRCTAMWHSTDGQHWTSMPGAQFNVAGVNDCADPCVDHIRFANDDVGYAFGPSAFYLTDNGGDSWQRQDGGALQLETLDGNVIRVLGTDSGCPGPCVDGIETSGVGATDWTPANVHVDSSSVNTVQLARGNGGDGYLLLTRNAAGGAENEMSTLYRSTDSGRSWERNGEPCPQFSREDDSIAIAGGADGRVSVLCRDRMSGGQAFVATSSDAGANFESHGIGAFDAPQMSLLTGDPATVLVAAGNGMARTVDGGDTWQKVQDVTGDIGWVGFESQTVGRAVSKDGTTIWTTRDGGATWHPASIG